MSVKNGYYWVVVIDKPDPIIAIAEFDNGDWLYIGDDRPYSDGGHNSPIRIICEIRRPAMESINQGAGHE